MGASVSPIARDDIIGPRPEGGPHYYRARQLIFRLSYPPVLHIHHNMSSERPVPRLFAIRHGERVMIALGLDLMACCRGDRVVLEWVRTLVLA